MQWSDVKKAPPPKMLRQFAGLSLVVFGALAAWRAWSGDMGAVTTTLAVVAVVIGVPGLIAPAVVRPVFVGWMIVAFPIGWAVSRVALGLMFFLMFLPVAMVFRMTGRDVLRLRRESPASYWVRKPAARSGEEYLRQF